MMGYLLSRGNARAALAAVVVCSLVPAKVRAQEGPENMRSVWHPSLGKLGLENLRCDCAFESDGSRLIFRSEPSVLSVIAGGPAARVFQRGDVIAQIDGMSLLTASGARRLAGVRPGEKVTLLVRRNGNVLRHSMIAVAVDEDYRRARAGTAARAKTLWPMTWYELPPAAPQRPSAPGGVVSPSPLASPGTVPTPPASPRATRSWVAAPESRARRFVPATPMAPEQPAVPAIPAQPATPRPAWVRPVHSELISQMISHIGWFGFSIRCSDCGWTGTGASGTTPVWESSSHPELSMVARGGPADLAGLKARDRITHIDGHSILSTEGGRRFGAVKPGQRVRLTLIRPAGSLPVSDGSLTITRTVVLGTRPELRAAIAATTPLTHRAPLPPSSKRELRYTGKLDDVSVEVWSSGGPTVERVGDTMVITVGGSVVRLKVEPRSR